MIEGIVDVLGLRGAEGPPLFDSFTGASIGAVNATYLAANAGRVDHGIDRLVKLWTELDLNQTLRFSPYCALWGWPRWRLPGRQVPSCQSGYVGRSLLDARPFEAIVERAIDWDRLHTNIRAGLVRALVIGAHDIFEECTTLFAEVAPGVPLRPYPYPSRTLVTRIAAEHVLASTALPIMFPAQSIGGRYYMDGGLRLPTPIIPALRVDAERVVVISLLHQPPAQEPTTVLRYPGFAFLLGEVCSAILLDSVLPSLQSLLQTNQILDVLAETLEPTALTAVTRDLERRQVLPTRIVPTLVFRPSENIALLTSAFLREPSVRNRLNLLWRTLLRGVKRGAGHQALLASILLLDGELAARLIELGRSDAHAKREQILAFFGH